MVAEGCSASTGECANQSGFIDTAVEKEFVITPMKEGHLSRGNLRIVADRLLFVLKAHKGDSNPGRSI